MYDHILVPLDGSELAERVLPHVRALAERFGSRVTLLQAVEPVSLPAMGAAAAVPYAGLMADPDWATRLEASARESRAYLASIGAAVGGRGIRVATEQPEGRAAEAVVAHARRAGVDLIAMTTRGRGGLGRLVLGSVADEVLRSAPCPVLLVRLA